MDVLGITVPVWGILILIAILLYTYMMSRHFWTFRKMGIPGPTPFPVIGTTVTKTFGVRAFDMLFIQKYGKVFGFYDLLSTNLVVADKEMLREILVKQFNNFPDRRVLEGFNGDLEHSLVQVKGEQWKHDRGIISPTFSSGKMRKMVPLIRTACETMVKACRVAIEQGDDGQVEMTRLFGGFTMDVIASTAFGIQVDSQGNPDDLFVKHARKMSDVKNFSKWLFVMIFFPALKQLLVKLDISFLPKDSMAYFRELTIQLIEERRIHKEAGRVDFLQLMVDSQESLDESEQSNSSTGSKQKVMALDRIIGNAEMFFAAGYSTTNVTLTMTGYNLATNPDCQDKIRQEIEETIGSDLLDYDNIQKLQYLDMCLCETLRMYPTALRIDRKCVKTTKVGDITIPAGMVVMVPVYAMHHDPDVWEKPDVFNPDRFSPTEKANHDPLDYMPFGYGPRNCIGMRLALLEAKMAIAQIVRNFRLCVGPKTDIPPKLEDIVFLTPEHLWLKLEEIK